MNYFNSISSALGGALGNAASFQQTIAPKQVMIDIFIKGMLLHGGGDNLQEALKDLLKLGRDVSKLEVEKTNALNDLLSVFQISVRDK